MEDWKELSGIHLKELEIPAGSEFDVKKSAPFAQNASIAPVARIGGYQR
jgi:hypothetical protein